MPLLLFDGSWIEPVFKFIGAVLLIGYITGFVLVVQTRSKGVRNAGILIMLVVGLLLYSCLGG